MFDLVEFIEENLEHAKETGVRYEWTAVCPFCENFGSFYINCNRRGFGPYICFKCENKSKSIVNLVSHVLCVSYDEAKKIVFGEEHKHIRTETKKSLKERIIANRKIKPNDIPEENNVPLPKEFIPVWRNNKWNIPLYMKNRGFIGSVLRNWEIGYARSGYYSHRVIVPIVCPNGRSFVARDLTGNSKIKYLNPKSSNHSKLLYGWKQNDLESDFILSEGPLDAMKLNQHGLSALALGGKILHPHQFKLLTMRSPYGSPTIMLDPDAYEESFTMAKTLSLYFKSVYIAKLSPDIDPGSSTREQAEFAYVNAIKFNEYRIRRFGFLMERLNKLKKRNNSK
jgi:hypothetical protein